MKWHPGHVADLPAEKFSIPESITSVKGVEVTVYLDRLPKNAEDVWAQADKLIEKAREQGAIPPKFWKNWWSGFKS